MADTAEQIRKMARALKELADLSLASRQKHRLQSGGYNYPTSEFWDDVATDPKNNPYSTQFRCLNHTWVETGMKKSWCKECDVEGVWTANGWQAIEK